MICERCGKEVKAVEVKCHDGKCERLCMECANKPLYGGDGTVYCVMNGDYMVEKRFVDECAAFEYIRDNAKRGKSYHIREEYVSTRVCAERISAYLVSCTDGKWSAVKTRDVFSKTGSTYCFAESAQEAIGMAKERHRRLVAGFVGVK